MGLSIHYSGTISSMDRLEELITETADICQSLGWSYHIIRESNDDGLNGICFSPEDCESIFLTFLPGGRMCSPVNLMNRDIYDGDTLEKELMYTTSTKTQFAGYNAHIAIIKLLRYLKEKYFKEFELDDEGKYWKTNDEKILLEQFIRYEFALNAVREALSDMKTIPGETVESLAERIEKVLKERLGEGK